MIGRTAWAFLVVLVGSCATLAAALNSRPQRTVSVTLVGALISPAKSNGHSWDLDLVVVPPEIQRRLEDLAQQATSKTLSGVIAGETGLPSEMTDGVSSAVVDLARNAIDQAAPDPFGFAVLSNNVGLSVAKQLSKQTIPIVLNGGYMDRDPVV